MLIDTIMNKNKANDNKPKKDSWFYKDILKNPKEKDKDNLT